MNTPDLNFLYVLQALAEERSVSRAADRLGLTQPAVSHALGKLRVLFQDDLFVRAGPVMAPTAVGERLLKGVEHVLAVVQEEIWSAKAFDAATTTRSFSVCLSDMGVIVLLPRLLAAFHERAPGAAAQSRSSCLRRSWRGRCRTARWTWRSAISAGSATTCTSSRCSGARWWGSSRAARRAASEA